MIRKLLFAGLFSLAAMASADAAVIYNATPNIPDDHGYGAWVNQSWGQNFVVKVNFAGPVAIDGFDIYVSPFADGAVVGAPVELKIFDQNPSLISGLTPDAYFSTISEVHEFDFHATNVAHADFAPIDLAAGDYWIGLSSTSTLDLSWTSYWKPNDIGERPLEDQIQLNGNDFMYYPALHDLAFNIDGSFLSAVPEPATWALFILGFGFVGTAMRAGRNSVRSAALEA